METAIVKPPDTYATLRNTLLVLGVVAAENSGLELWTQHGAREGQCFAFYLRGDGGVEAQCYRTYIRSCVKPLDAMPTEELIRVGAAVLKYIRGE